MGAGLYGFAWEWHWLEWCTQLAKKISRKGIELELSQKTLQLAGTAYPSIPTPLCYCIYVVDYAFSAEVIIAPKEGISY